MPARSRLLTDNTPRHCSRCGDELTDPASRESGVGPVCRRKDNHLYAKVIPANFAIASIRALSLKPEMLVPECVKPWQKAQKLLLKRAEKAQQENSDVTAVNLRGQDLREVIRTLDYLCSFSHPDTSVRRMCIDMIRALGYVGLAAVIDGQASTSPAKIWFSEGRVYMEGLGNTSGWRTMRQIAGIVTPRYRGDRAPYSAPAQSAQAFLAAVMNHWPMYEGDASEVQEQAEAYVVEVAASGPAPSATPVGIVASILVRSSDFTLTFPWRRDRNMSAFLGELKSLPPLDRRYDPNTKAWCFLSTHLTAVQGMAAKYYDSVTTVVTAVQTPVDTYATRKYPHIRRNYAARARSYFRRW